MRVSSQERVERPKPTSKGERLCLLTFPLLAVCLVVKSVMLFVVSPSFLGQIRWTRNYENHITSHGRSHRIITGVFLYTCATVVI